MGFEEMPHTADCAVWVWANGMEALLTEAARALNEISGLEYQQNHRVSRPLNVRGQDAEGLLIAFLSELIYLQEQESMAFDEFKIEVDGRSALGLMRGRKFTSISRPIKAVTFHELVIRSTERGLEAKIVFDA